MNRIFAIGICLLLVGCSGQKEESGLKFTDQQRSVPSFNADSAYAFVKQQVELGPRIPNTKPHREAKNYFEQKLQSYAGSNSVFAQNFTVEGYEGEALKLSNIIAAFNTSSTDRIMLCAHWDTRAVSDEDSVAADQSFPGADDGGSGVAVLLELARLLSENPPPVGVDIVLFDGEDYGKSGDLRNYFLGSRYWADNPPVPGYSPRFGILVDMVGATNATFPKEGYSMNYAPNLVDEIWDIAEKKGYRDLFLSKRGSSIQDDHVIINQQTNIPMVDIINHKSRDANAGVFPDHWHTQGDNMNVIDKKTLKAVGEVLAELIYNRI
ncbi:MAG: M28 family peptidase [Balneolaceae bacterium]|nr:M28 family peptidase [Balneolaceae bacterium]